jgi:fructokinase
VIAVVGEALIDLVADDGGLRPFLGGGPFNTAVALGRLGVPVAFLGCVSYDRFGRALEEQLAADRVDRRYVLRTTAPTPLAVVQTRPDADAEYTFYLAGTAYACIEPANLPALGPEVAALHLGTLALATDPPAAALELLIERESQTRLIVVDPNVRPSVFGDRNVYRQRFELLAAQAHVIKLSAADAEWLYPGVPHDAVPDLVLEHGARLAVLTLGEHGALARSASGGARAASPRVDVVDTIGAGDAFGAGLLRWLWITDRLDARAVGGLDDAELADGLAFATAVAALQCSRAGATSPTLDEVEAFLRSLPR